MKRLKPSLKPQNINPNFWYYEDKRSLDFYITPRQSESNCGRVRTSKLLKSLSRIYGIDFNKIVKQQAK